MEAVEAEASPEMHQEVEVALGIEDEEALGEEGGEGHSVLGEGIEVVILISRGLAFVAGDHDSSDLALRQRALYLRNILKRKSFQIDHLGILCRKVNLGKSKWNLKHTDTRLNK